MANEVKLETKLVCDIKGDFFVPSYQRGYRWGKQEVERLLDDVYSTEGEYCLQPVVVKRKEDSKEDNQYELIDGQQRLTTLYLIYSYMIKKCIKEHLNLFEEEGPKFSLSYETRKKSEDFLGSIADDNEKDNNEKKAKENIDYSFMWQAYKSIKAWFEGQAKGSEQCRESVVKKLEKLKEYFDKTVRVIWYEVGPAEDAIALFTRLNIGKIPLTNAELVKALFLRGSDNSGGNGVSKESQEEVGRQWDDMERELHDESLWYFLTNKTDKDYPTRIDLILDTTPVTRKDDDKKGEDHQTSGKSTEGSGNKKEAYATFFKFNGWFEVEEDHKFIWSAIQKTFLTLKAWYNDPELYHKIGYLIASEQSNIQKLYREYSITKEGLTKSEFREDLTDSIKKKTKIESYLKDLDDLRYGENSEEIKKLLLLFNVASIQKNGRFPFDKYKKDKWSLEHIHPQNPDPEDWGTQLWKKIGENREHPGEDEKKARENLAEKCKAAIDEYEKDNLSGEKFIKKIIMDILVELEKEREGCKEFKEDEWYIYDPNSIANLALLGKGNNASLSNNAFAVKRQEIIDKSEKEIYIPLCTRNVFLKYYTPSAGKDKNEEGTNAKHYAASENYQLYFWGPEDRAAYVECIKNTLKSYLGINDGEEK